MNTQTAHEFLTRCFHPGETIALLLRKENPGVYDAAHRDGWSRPSHPAISRGCAMRTTTARTSMSLPIRFALAAERGPRNASPKFAIFTSTST